MPIDLSGAQCDLQDSLRRRNLSSNWNDGRLEIGSPAERVVLSFDFPPTLEGAAVVRRPRDDDSIARIAFFESLRVGSLEDARAYVSECEDAGLESGAPTNWDHGR